MAQLRREIPIGGQRLDRQDLQPARHEAVESAPEEAGGSCEASMSR